MAFALALAACSASDGGGTASTGPSPAAGSSSDELTATPPSTTALTTTTTTTTTTPAASGLNGALFLTSLGRLQIGQTYGEAEAATGLQVVTDDRVAGPECVYGSLVGAPDGVSFLGSDGIVVRINVHRPSDIRTRSGIGIGSTESSVLTAYPGQITSEQHAYVQGGKYLEYTPQDPSLADYRLVFETNEQATVTGMRTGRLPEARYIEGCL